MPTQRIVIEQEWVQVTTDSTQRLIECTSGFGIIVAAASAPDDNQTWGHNMLVGETAIVSEPTFARADPSKGECIFILT